MPITPDQYRRASPTELLEAIARGHVAFDHRVLHALLDDIDRTLPAIARFAEHYQPNDRLDLTPELVRLFCVAPDPSALPFLISRLRASPDEVADELTEALARIGAPSIDPLLALIDELGAASGETAFILCCLGVRDDRIQNRIEAIRATDPDEAGFLQSVYDEQSLNRKEWEPFEVWAAYPESAEADLDLLPEEERLEFLASPYLAHRENALESWRNKRLEAPVLERVFEVAVHDPDMEVRSLAWEALRDHTDDDTIRNAMLERLAAGDTQPAERASLACALAYFSQEPPVHEAIEAAYQSPSFRAKAIEAMWRSFDDRYIDHIRAHLRDEDPEVLREAIAGVGFMRIAEELDRMEELFKDEEWREDALFSWVVAAPGDASKSTFNRIRKVVAELAGPLGSGDEAIVEEALRLRADMFAAAEAVKRVKVGRNDPCPCGSGKKFKKCCGA